MSVTHVLPPIVGTTTERSRVTAVLRWTLLAGIVASALSINRLVVSLDALPMAPYEVPWWALAAAFAAAGVFVVHLPVGDGSHSISLSEVVLVVGLGLTGPAGLITGRMVGATVAHAVRRRQPNPMTIFHLGLAYLEVTVAIAVYRRLLGDAAPVEPTAWSAAVGGALSAAVIGWIGSTLAASSLDGNSTRDEIRNSLRVGSVVALGAGLLGLVFLMIVWHDVRALWIVVVLACMLYVSVAAFGRLARKHLDLESVFAFSREIQRPLHTEEVVTTTLAQVRKHMRAEVAEMLVFSPDSAERCQLVSLRSDDLRFRTIHPSLAKDLLRMVMAHPDERWFTPNRGSVWLRQHYRPLGVRSGLISPVRTEEGIVAMLVAGNRRGPTGVFSPEDLPLLEVLAKQTSDTLARTELLERVEREAAERKRQAADMVRAKDEFIASVSHELRTPLTAVYSSAQLLQEALEVLPPEEQLELIGYISRESGDLANLVEDLLVNARADVGTLTVKPEQMDLTVEIAASLQAIPALDEGRTIDASGVDGAAHADPLRFRQVMRNLLTNAVRYGGDTITVRSHSTRAGTVVSVCDNGPGIPLEQRDAIFEPYQRAHTATGVTESVGLGLSVARQLAELMDGHLSYHYVDGISTFELLLPAEAAEDSGSVALGPRRLHTHRPPDRGLFAPRREVGIPTG